MELRKRRLTRMRSSAAQRLPVLETNVAVWWSGWGKKVLATSRPLLAHSWRQRRPLLLGIVGGRPCCLWLLVLVLVLLQGTLLLPLELVLRVL